MDHVAANPRPERAHPGAVPRLETPLVAFGRIPLGESVARPVTVSGPVDDIEVVVPPLAPFSVMPPPAGRAADGATSTIWVRYDAGRSMGHDRGHLVVASPSTGHRWTVELSGAEELAR